MPTKKTRADETLQKKRRERVATACLQGLAAGTYLAFTPGDEDKYEEELRKLSAVAIDLADELIEQLDEPIEFAVEEDEDEEESDEEDGEDEKEDDEGDDY